MIDFPQYVASFGKDAALGCFDAAEPMAFARNQRVLLETPRGLEVGQILCPASIRQARLLGAQVRGKLLRPLTSADDQTFDAANRLARDLFTAACEDAEASSLPVSLLDAEVFFDGKNALLHILHAGVDDLAPLAQTLGDRFHLDVRFANLAQPMPVDDHDHDEANGCGEPGCGKTEGGGCTSCSTGGGCSTGGCSAGTAAPPDLRPYFSHLRDQMESTRRTPLA